MSFYRSNGILYQTSCNETLQQDVVVERKQFVLFIFNLRYPFLTGGECVKTATYLKNRMPSRKLGNISQFEILFHRKPDYSMLKAFGCLCFLSTLKHDRNKLDPRANTCVFIGYPSSQKGYRVLNLFTMQTSVSKDVRLFENHFPFHISTNFHVQPPPFYLPVDTELPAFTDYVDVDVFNFIILKLHLFLNHILHLSLILHLS